MKHKLDLLGNAVDSLNQGLKLYIEGRDGTVGAYKFAVLHLSHYLELLFKHAVAEEHRLLIYKKPDSKSLSTEATIGLWGALNILRNVGHSFDEQLLKDLKWFKGLRNDIEHFQFEMDADEVKATIGRLVKAAHDFADEAIEQDIARLVSPALESTYRELFDDYLSRLQLAKATAAKAVTDETELSTCHWCGECDVAIESGKIIHCFLCDEDEEKHECSICGEVCRESEMSVWNDENPHGTDYACNSCEDHIFGTD